MKELRCSDAGFDCREVIRGEDEDEVMARAAEHAREAHGMEDVDPETSDRLRSLIHEA